MKKFFPYLLVLILFLSGCNVPLPVNGQTKLTVQQAIEKFEEKIQSKVLLPDGTLLYHFAPGYGIINHEESRLDLIYINKKNQSETLKVYIQPATSDLMLEQGDQEYTLEDGTRVIYRPYFSAAYAIEFQKNGLDYTLGLSKNGKNNDFGPDELLKIANGLK